MQIDEKALEAAIVAVESMGCVHFGAEIEAAIRAYLESATPPDELSGNPGELIDKMADAIRGDTVLDDTPWEMLSEDRKIGWRGDAERALAVVKEYLTSQAATALRLSAGGSARLEALEAALEEARDSARDWHRQCETVATILDLPEPEGAGRHAEMVRTKFEALEAENARLREIVGAVEQHDNSNFYGPDADKNRRASWRGVMRKIKTSRRAREGGNADV